MASSRLLRGRNQFQNPTPWAAGGRVPLRLWQGLRSTRPPAPEEVCDAEVTPRLTNPYIVETASGGRAWSVHHNWLLRRIRVGRRRMGDRGIRPSFEG
jgi:hypothetical protein